MAVQNNNGNIFGEKSGGNGQKIGRDMNSNFGRRGRGTLIGGNLPMAPHDQVVEVQTEKVIILNIGTLLNNHG